jgi:hypothetical protein
MKSISIMEREISPGEIRDFLFYGILYAMMAVGLIIETLSVPLVFNCILIFQIDIFT